MRVAGRLSRVGWTTRPVRRRSRPGGTPGIQAAFPPPPKD
jgi:hypothetical protein